VLDSIASANGLRPVFEPLNPFASELGRRYAHKTLDRDDSADALKEFLDSVIAGRRIRLWTRYRRQWRMLIPAGPQLWGSKGISRVTRNWTRLAKEAPGLARMASNRDPLVKCIWSNLMLGWIVRQFDCRLVFLVRHPGAVIESELRNNWQAAFALDRFRGDPRFQEITSGRYRAFLNQELTPTEGLAVRWLVENQTVIEQAVGIGAEVVFYEHLKSTPASAWERVCRALGVHNIPSVATLEKPSQQSAPSGSAAAVRAMEPPQWRTSLTQSQLGAIQSILDRAKFDLYSMDVEEPQSSSADPAAISRHGVLR
jgi:hypothetical protein